MEIFGLSMILITLEMNEKSLPCGKVSESVEMMEARPRARNIVDRVAMNGCMLNSSIKVPASRPNTAPMSSMMIMTRKAGTPAFASFRPTTAVMATIAPTDKSIPPVRIGRVMATARIIR